MYDEYISASKLDVAFETASELLVAWGADKDMTVSATEEPFDGMKPAQPLRAIRDDELP